MADCSVIPSKRNRNDRPTVKELNNHVVEQYAIHWRQLGAELGLKDFHIANITENNASRQLRLVEHCSSQMLQKWLEINPLATWGKLDDAVKNIKSSTTSPASTDKGDMEPEIENVPVTSAMVENVTSVESEEEKLKWKEGSPQKQKIETPKSEMPPQVSNEDGTLIAPCTDNITDEFTSMTLQNDSGYGTSHSTNNTAGLQGVDNTISHVGDVDSSTKNTSSKRVCKAVSDFYCGQFKDRWKVRTDSSHVNVVAALLVERNGELKVVVLATGTIKKKVCSYKSNVDGLDDECVLGVCDGHAESVCYRLASLYLVNEIHRHDKNPANSILECTFSSGYTLKEGIKFHFFTTQPPCGFMAKEQRYFLSWKIPFKEKPHCLKCSSTILIGAYLGIQGPLSHLFSEPIYISSITITKCKSTSVSAQKRIQCFKECIQCFKNFQALISEDINSNYHLVIPNIEIADVCSEDLFDIKPYSDVKFSSCGQLEIELEERCNTENETIKTAGAVSCDSNVGSHIMIFTLKNGMDKKVFHEKMKFQITDATNISSGKSIKETNLEKLKKAQKRLSAALNISKALEKLKSQITEKINERFITHCSDDEVSIKLKEIEECRFQMGKLTEQVNKLKDSFGATVKQFEKDSKVRTEISSSAAISKITEQFKTASESMIENVDLLNKSIKDFGNGTKSIVDELTDYCDYKETLDDLNKFKFLEKGDTSSFDLGLMGCDWARYMKLMCADKP